MLPPEISIAAPGGVLACVEGRRRMVSTIDENIVMGDCDPSLAPWIDNRK